MDVTDLLHVADDLDFLGLQKEADIIDSLIEKHAQLLSLSEKPMLAHLARIVLILKKFKPNEPAKGVDATFPISQTPLLGMTRQRAIEELQKHFKAYIEQRLMPTLEKYTGTAYEAGYRSFIEEMQELSRSLSGLLPARTEQQSIRDVLTAIEQVKRALGKLVVHIKIREEGGVSPNPQAETLIKQGVEVLSDLESAIKRLDEESVEEGIKKLKTLFPRNLSSDSPFYSLLYDAYRQGTLPFVGEKEVNEQILDRMDPSVRLELEKVDTQLKTLGDERAKKQVLLEQIEDLEERFNELIENVKQAETIKPTRSLTIQEYDTLLKDVYVPPKIYDYRNRYRKYDQVAGDVTILERWLNNFNKDTDINQRIPFGLYLSRGRNPTAAQSAITMIQRNISDLKAEVEHDLELVERGSDKAQRILLQNIGYRSDIANRVVWEEWYDRFISRLTQMLRYTLTPEVRGDESADQAFNRVLRGFQKLLNYEL